MSDIVLDTSESALTRLILAAGRRLLPAGLDGGLDLELPSGRTLRIGQRQVAADATLVLSSWQPLWAAMRKASIGFAESYLDGGWDSPDPGAVIRFYLRNRNSLNRAGRPIFPRSLADYLRHIWRRNSRAGARRNITAHYDLGNDFYALWLDSGMTYSSGYFHSGTETIEQAQAAKYGLILDALDLETGHTVLELGCGWGGCAEAAARRGAQVTAITISPEQCRHATARLAGQGLQAVALDRDYRDTAGKYDRLVSIEMIEAVGEEHWRDYFAVVRQRLKPDGVAILQAITISEAHYRRYRAGADFIQRHIFPGGMLPTGSAMREHATAAGLTFEPILGFGDSYARTLRIWRERFEAAWPDIAKLGFDARFRRMWRYYLAYCEAGFAEGAIDVGLYRLRPAAGSR
jgi:cyclopropane-fatty-acyl-phospholipid synthase